MTRTTPKRRRHRWVHMMATRYTCGYSPTDGEIIRGCGVVRDQEAKGWIYWYDGKWRSKCPPCEPERIDDD